MSKLVNCYKNLKSNDSSSLYLFKSGVFYIFLDEDAKIISNLLHLKLTNLNSEIQKCGFPANSLEKYLTLLKLIPYEVKIIDNTDSVSYTPKQFSINKEILDFLSDISILNVETLSVSQAFNFLSSIKEKAIKLLND